MIILALGTDTSEIGTYKKQTNKQKSWELTFALTKIQYSMHAYFILS